MANDYQQKDNNGTLFKNDRKESEKHPDYKGDATINGQPMWISAWIKEGAKGKFMSLAFNPKDSGGNKPQPKPNAPSVESDAPF
jgi:hypothetical protein